MSGDTLSKFLSLVLRHNPALIGLNARRPLRATLAQAWAAADQTWSPSVEANGWQLMMSFAELGMGVAIVNDFCAPPRGTVRRPLSGLPSVQYQLLRLERDLFGRCFTPGDADITKLPDPEPLSRYLVRHEAQLALHVLGAAGPIPAVQQLLDDTQCSIVNLPACAATLDALEELRSALLETPEDTVPLADAVPAWGIFDFKVADYSLLPD